jgi:hypothetical protein
MMVVWLIVIGICGFLSGWFLGYVENGFAYLKNRVTYFAAFAIGTVGMLWLNESATAALLGMIIWILSGGTGYTISINRLNHIYGTEKSPQASAQVYPKCSMCSRETSMTGNLTNMYALGMGHAPDRFHREYGMMCADHASELTGRFLEEAKVSEADVERGRALAIDFMMKKLT